MAHETPRHPSAQRVDRVLRERGLEDRVRELPDSTRTAPEAAAAVGCDVRQIVKSLVFRTARSGAPVLVLASGGHRVDEQWMEREVGEPLVRADPEAVRSLTGFAIGGVPPFGHPVEIPTFIDYDLLEFREVWAAAGHPNAIFRLTSRELLGASRGRAVPVTPQPAPREEVPWATFDCYGTLVDWNSGLLSALESVAGPLAPSERERFFPAFLREEQLLEEAEYRSYREVLAEAARAAAASLRLSWSGAGAERFADSIPDWPIFPGAREGLERLRARGLRLGLLSNMDRDLLEATIERHDLPIDAAVSATDVRSYKPLPAHWIRFLKREAVLPATVWHLSSSAHYDLEPARRLGFRTGYVVRAPGTGRESSIADAIVPDLGQWAAKWVPPVR